MATMFDLLKWLFPALSLLAVVVGLLSGSWLWTVSGLLFFASCMWFKLAVAKASGMPAKRWSLLFGLPLLAMICLGVVLSFWGVNHYAGIIAVSYIAGLATNPLIRLIRA